MLTFDIKSTQRAELGKTQMKKVRAKGLVPCALYSNGVATHLSVAVADIKPALYTSETYLINLDIDGVTRKAIVREAVFHPVHDDVLHVDFVEVHDDRPIQVQLPVKITGTSPGVLMGGKLVQKLRKMRVRGVHSKLPSFVEININDLKLGRSLTVGDLDFKDFMIAMAKDVPLVSVEITRSLRQEATAAAKAKK